jgi:S1-C subfamily serine protease
MVVQPGSVAEKAGFRVGDVITTYDGSAIHNAADLQAAAVSAMAKADVSVTVVRADGNVELHPKF